MADNILLKGIVEVKKRTEDLSPSKY